MSSNVGNVQVGIGMILFCLVIAVPVFVVAYRAGRTRGRRGQWQPFAQRAAAPAPPPPATPSAGVSISVRAPIPIVRTLMALSGSLLLLIGCFVPGSMFDRSVFGVGSLMGVIVYGACAVVAALLAATGRFRSLMLVGAICLLSLLNTYWEITRAATRIAQDPRMKDIPMKDFLQPGAAWYVLLAGAIVLFLIGLVGPPERSGAYVHPSQR